MPVVPRAGRVLVFQHNILHEGSTLISGTKYAMRTDVMYKCKELGWKNLHSKAWRLFLICGAGLSHYFLFTSNNKIHILSLSYILQFFCISGLRIIHILLVFFSIKIEGVPFHSYFHSCRAGWENNLVSSQIKNFE